MQPNAVVIPPPKKHGEIFQFRVELDHPFVGDEIPIAVLYAHVRRWRRGDEPIEIEGEWRNYPPPPPRYLHVRPTQCKFVPRIG